MNEKALFAGGCFLGIESLLKALPGVLSTRVGCCGGTTENPSYEEVCSGKTGHAEAVDVVFDPSQISFEKLAKFFFEIHDPTQKDRQGPDVGSQYRSVIFFFSEEQKKTALALIAILREKGIDVQTEVALASVFCPAEKYHQKYYDKTGKQQYCHFWNKKF